MRDAGTRRRTRETLCMTSRERLVAAMRGQPTDRVPVAPFGLGRVGADSPLGQRLVEETDLLLDVWSGADPFLGSLARVERRTEGQDQVVSIEAPGGPLIRRSRQTHLAHATVEFPLRGPEDVERFLAIPYAPPEPDLTAYRAWNERLGSEGLVLTGIGNAICLAAEWFSPLDLCITWADCPEAIERLTAVASARLNAYVERLCREGVEAFRIVGGEYVSVQLGLDAFDRLIVPFDTELIRTIHRHGALAYYHNHGPVMRYLTRLRALGMDALDPLEAPPWGDAHLGEARRVVGPRLCLVGNLDDMEVLDQLPEEQILRLARERLKEAGGGPFILGGTASGTYGEQAARAFLAMARLVRQG